MQQRPQIARKKIKSLTEMIRALRLRCSQLKEEVIRLEGLVAKLESQSKDTFPVRPRKYKRNKLEDSEDTITEENMDILKPLSASGQIDTVAKDELRAANHFYLAETMILAIEMVTIGSNSLRSVQKNLELFNKHHEIVQTPSFQTVRQWVYRLGYYELTRELEHRDDWIVICDFTVSIGKLKCFLVLGVSLEDLKKRKFHLRHNDMSLLGLEVWERTSGKLIEASLAQIEARVGRFVQIVADGGSDITKGVRLFCEGHQKTVGIYDISHKLARILEKHLKNDEKFTIFLSSLSTVKSQTQQTELSCLRPPTQRSKARFMNLRQLTRWAIRILDYEQNGNFKELGLGYQLDKAQVSEFASALNKSGVISKLEVLVEKEDDEEHFRDKLGKLLDDSVLKEWAEKIVTKANQGQQKFEERFGWLKEQTDEINQYSIFLELVQMVESELKRNGLSHASVSVCRKHLDVNNQSDRTKKFSQDIMEFLTEQVKLVPHGQSYLASSDIIESVFGKFKYLNKRMSVTGITQGVLLLGTIISTITPETMKVSMEQVPWSIVVNWFESKVPITDWKRRCRVFLWHNKKKEQKQTIPLC